MIAFIEGGMTIPMGTIIRNYLRYFRLSPTQCAPNMFRVLGCIEVLNQRMNINLTHHDVNWIYNLQHLKRQGYYLKSKQSEVMLIQCLPVSNKGIKEDFLIFSGQWHDGLPCPVKEGEPGGKLTVWFYHLTLHNFCIPFAVCHYWNESLLFLLTLQIPIPLCLHSAQLTRRAQTRFYKPRFTSMNQTVN